MPTLAAIDDLGLLLDDVNRLTQRDLLALWRVVQDRDPQYIRDALAQDVPEIVEIHSRIAADLTATWYEELDPQSAFAALPAPASPVEQTRETAVWAANALFRPGAATPLDLLSGAIQRTVFNTSRDTVVANAARERVRWARVTRSDAKVCEFCAMLASRGYVYGSDAQTTQVGASGLRQKYNYKGQRQGTTVQRGRLDRAIQSLGSSYHDSCRCRAVPNRGGSELPDVVGLYEERYRQAVAATSTGGAIDLKKVMAYMRANP